VLSGNVTLILNDDCMYFSFDFFMILFTHCVMVDKSSILYGVIKSLLYRVLNFK
jgi:hypothetical protein